MDGVVSEAVRLGAMRRDRSHAKRACRTHDRMVIDAFLSAVDGSLVA
jgi:hypothetical protein